MSPKIWVIMIGGILGIVAMRCRRQLLVLVQRYPALVDRRVHHIAWVGVKLGIEVPHGAHYIASRSPQWLSLGLFVDHLRDRPSFTARAAGAGSRKRTRGPCGPKKCSRGLRSKTNRTSAWNSLLLPNSELAARL
jgi:hypothetical protein